MPTRLLACCLLLVFLASPIGAAEIHPNTSAEAIRAQQQQIRIAAQARKGRYEKMPEEARARLLTQQDTVERLLGNVSATTELPEATQIALFNALESIEAIVNKAEEDRMICQRYKPAGSNRPVTQCKTVAQRREEREAAQRDVDRRDQTCVKDVNGMCN